MRPDFKNLPVLCLLALLAACGQKSAGNGMKGDIVEKIERPGGGVAAVSTREATDAKTPPRYHVYLQKSQDPAQAVEIARAMFRDRYADGCVITSAEVKP